MATKQQPKPEFTMEQLTEMMNAKREQSPAEYDDFISGAITDRKEAFQTDFEALKTEQAELIAPIQSQINTEVEEFRTNLQTERFEVIQPKIDDITSRKDALEKLANASGVKIKKGRGGSNREAGTDPRRWIYFTSEKYFNWLIENRDRLNADGFYWDDVSALCIEELRDGKIWAYAEDKHGNEKMDAHQTSHRKAWMTHKTVEQLQGRLDAFKEESI